MVILFPLLVNLSKVLRPYLLSTLSAHLPMICTDVTFHILQ
jgi:hypothetical protein